MNGNIQWKGVIYKPLDFLEKITQPGINWLVQEFIKQHSEVCKLNPTSVNTMRIVTFCTEDGIMVAPIIMRYGRENSLFDNQCFFVGINNDGTVMHDAFDFVNKKRSICHAERIKIPFFNEAIELAKSLHSFIPEIFTVGWDICITSNGPLVIEGNDGWDPFLTQTPPGNQMRVLWNKYLSCRISDVK